MKDGECFIIYSTIINLKVIGLFNKSITTNPFGDVNNLLANFNRLNKHTIL